MLGICFLAGCGGGATDAAVKPGTVLYQANWSPGLKGWTGDSHWRTQQGQLYRPDPTGNTLLTSSYSISAPNYALVAAVRLPRPTAADSATSFGLGMIDSAKFKQGMAVVLSYGRQATLNPKYLLVDAYHHNPIATLPAKDVDANWHEYRLEVRTTHVRFLLDRHLEVQANVPPLTPGLHPSLSLTTGVVKILRVVALSATGDESPTSVVPTPAPTPPPVLDLTGQNSYNTAPFTVPPEPWTLQYSWHCTSPDAKLQIAVAYPGNNGNSVPGAIVNAVSGSNPNDSGTLSVPSGGTYQILVVTDPSYGCSWHISVLPGS